MKAHTYKSNFTTQMELCPAKNKNLTVVYVHGLCSDPWGRKPEEIKAEALACGAGFFRFELAGHGSDVANYLDTDFNIWLEQLLEVLDTVVAGDVILVGSSLGGWLSLRAAMERPSGIKGILGLAAGPDFVADFEEYLSDDHKNELKNKGRLKFANNDFEYTITQKLIDSCFENLILNQEIPVFCPVTLVQGTKDASLDWRKALKIQALLASDNVIVKILKGSGHRLGADKDILEARQSLKNLIDSI